jgi:hypothetical protein
MNIHEPLKAYLMKFITTTNYILLKFMQGFDTSIGTCSILITDVFLFMIYYLIKLVQKENQTTLRSSERGKKAYEL